LDTERRWSARVLFEHHGQPFPHSESPGRRPRSFERDSFQIQQFSVVPRVVLQPVVELSVLPPTEPLQPVECLWESALSHHPDALEGPQPGTHVAVRYRIVGKEESVEEIDRVADEGLKVTEGTVVRLDRRRQEILEQT
jgi:hypothetical protein